MDTIQKLREHIDHIDNQLLELIHKRISLMKAIGDAKKNSEKPIRDAQREDAKVSMVKEKAQKLGLPTDIILKIWNLFFETSIEIEK